VASTVTPVLISEILGTKKSIVDIYLGCEPSSEPKETLFLIVKARVLEKLKNDRAKVRTKNFIFLIELRVKSMTGVLYYR